MLDDPDKVWTVDELPTLSGEVDGRGGRKGGREEGRSGGW